MGQGLDRPADRALLAEQADRLSGQASIDRYLELMLGQPQAKVHAER
jgi:hypothetical protein